MGNEASGRTPARTPSPVYQYQSYNTNPQKVSIADSSDVGSTFETSPTESKEVDVQVSKHHCVPLPFCAPYWPCAPPIYPPSQPHPCLPNTQLEARTCSVAGSSSCGPPSDNTWQAVALTRSNGISNSAAQKQTECLSPLMTTIDSGDNTVNTSQDNSAKSGKGKKNKLRLKAAVPKPSIEMKPQGKDRGRNGHKGEKGRCDRNETEHVSKTKAAYVRSHPGKSYLERIKKNETTVQLIDLISNITEIAQDQYGSRLIQRKLEVASVEEKQHAFKSIFQNMSQLTVDVFGNYVIQKFFEHGSVDQRRILAEQLIGQVLKLSLQMYGCRVVQKALDSVPIEQQVLLISELQGHVIQCIEDQHGNHVIQKCIERLPTDRINFIVEAFEGHASRMARHPYGCRVIQRLIEYCSSVQISSLLDEVLRWPENLATDQYGNYVVQHIIDQKDSRPGDREKILQIVHENILDFSCHKYASNVVEKALTCGASEERELLIEMILGKHNVSNPPLATMIRDQFGNYIVQRAIALADNPTLVWRLRAQMPSLRKSHSYEKHIITALERAQGQFVS